MIIIIGIVIVIITIIIIYYILYIILIYNHYYHYIIISLLYIILCHLLINHSPRNILLIYLFPTQKPPFLGESSIVTGGLAIGSLVR